MTTGQSITSKQQLAPRRLIGQVQDLVGASLVRAWNKGGLTEEQLRFLVQRGGEFQEQFETVLHDFLSGATTDDSPDEGRRVYRICSNGFTRKFVLLAPQGLERANEFLAGIIASADNLRHSRPFDLGNFIETTAIGSTLPRNWRILAGGTQQKSAAGDRIPTVEFLMAQHGVNGWSCNWRSMRFVPIHYRYLAEVIE